MDDETNPPEGEGKKKRKRKPKPERTYPPLPPPVRPAWAPTFTEEESQAAIRRALRLLAAVPLPGEEPPSDDNGVPFTQR